MRFPCVHAAATTPVQQLGVVLAHSHPAVSAFPERGIGSACTSSFSRIARRSLTLRPAHSRGHLFVTRYPKASDISSPPCLLRLLPAGAISPGGPCTHWKAPPFTAHPLSRHSPTAVQTVRPYPFLPHQSRGISSPSFLIKPPRAIPV